MRRTCLIAAFALIGRPVAAHHSGALYDYAQRTTVSGVVTKMEWANPHSRLYVEGQDGPSEMAQWRFDLPSVNRLVRLGWTRHALNAGDKVTVICAPLRGTPHVAWAVNVLDASGKKLFVGSPTGTSQ
jgi:Family of unknown function (DUF6152)